jgi:ribosome-binding protein aMBF1 (putative translation factor)
MQTQTPPFHELIETARKRAGLSHDQLSSRAQTSAGYTHRICAGTAKPGRDMIIRLGLAMNLSVDELDELLTAAGHLRLLANEPKAGASKPAGQVSAWSHPG